MTILNLSKMMGPDLAGSGGSVTNNYPGASLASFIADFAGNAYYTRDASLSTGWSTISNPFTTTNSGGTYTNSSGVLTASPSNTIRLTYDPVTLQALGVLVEEQRTNLFLNSKIDGTNLSTQTVTVANASTYTLSFYGTGQIVLSGANTSTVVGTGAYPSRQTLSFTTTSTSLTATVTGTVQYAQLELAPFVSTFIPTAASSVTRTVDVITRALGTEYSATANSVLSKGIIPSVSATNRANIMNYDDGTLNNRCWQYMNSGNTNMIHRVTVSNVDQAVINRGSPTGTSVKFAGTIVAADYRAVLNAGGVGFVSSGTKPTVTTMRIGAQVSGSGYWNSTVSLLMNYPIALANSQLITVTG